MRYFQPLTLGKVLQIAAILNAFLHPWDSCIFELTIIYLLITLTEMYPFI